MLAEIELNVLHCLDRTSLEWLQMHRLYLRDLVNQNKRTLALRPIHSVVMFGNDVTIQLEAGEGNEMVMPARNERDLEALFDRVNNAFIHELLLAFTRKRLRFPHYLMANAAKLQCKIKALEVDTTRHGIDYALVDFIGVHLKPQVYEAVLNFDEREVEDHVMLFTRNSMRGNVTHLEYQCWDTPAPQCVIPELFGVDVVETCAMITQVDPRPWIRKFIETFEKAERGADVVRSVTFLHEDSPLSHIADTLGQPRLTDAPTPQSAFLKENFGSAESL